MKRLISSPCLVLALAALSFTSCSKPQPATSQPAAAPAITSLDQKVSYGIGYNIGTSLTRDNLVQVDQAVLLAGIADGLAKAKMRVPETELDAAFASMQERATAAAAAAGEKQLALGKEYLATNKARPSVKETASGLQYEVLAKGTGAKPKATDTVKVHYHGTLVDGTVFDSSVERGAPIDHPVNGFVTGWIEALQLMSVGDKWKLTVPPALGYGARPNGKIPANSVLIFEVELLGIK